MCQVFNRIQMRVIALLVLNETYYVVLKSLGLRFCYVGWGIILLKDAGLGEVERIGQMVTQQTQVVTLFNSDVLWNCNTFLYTPVSRDIPHDE